MSEPLSQEEEDLIRQINTGGGGGLGREASLAKLRALHASTLSLDLQNLTSAIDSAKTTLGTRIGEMNQQIRDSSEYANTHSQALVHWTKWSVRVTAAYVALTAGLLWVSYNQIQVAISALQAQAEPELLMEVVGTQLIIKNEGTYPVTNVNIDISDIQFVGSPYNQTLSEIKRLNELKGAPWWEIGELKAGKTEDKTLEEIGQNALEGQRNHKPSIENGEVPGIPAGSKVQILSFI